MTTWPAYDSPAPNAIRSAVSPAEASSCRIIASIARGTEAADVLPESMTSVATATVSGSLMFFARVWVMRRFA